MSSRYDHRPADGVDAWLFWDIQSIVVSFKTEKIVSLAYDTGTTYDLSLEQAENLVTRLQACIEAYKEIDRVVGEDIKDGR